jgi:hypothetical protein
MPIRFALYANPFKKDQPERVARVVPKACLGDEDVLEMMLHRNTGLSRSEIMAVLEEYGLALEYLLQEGYSVHTSLMKLETSLQGKFRDENDRYDPKRHRLKLNITPGKRLRAVFKNQKAYRQAATTPRPRIEVLLHFDPELPPHHLQPGMALRLQGHHLKVDPAREDEGIFLLAAGQPSLKIRQLITNTPSELLVVLPTELPASTYRLEVRTRVGNSTELRTGTYPQPLSCHPDAVSEQ